MTAVSVHWFRKGLRLHDNPALLEACKSHKVFPVFCLDPLFANSEWVGVNRYSFLLESLIDLDTTLRSFGSRLFVIRGKPTDVLPHYVNKWGAELLTFESDTEPYSLARDRAIVDIFANTSLKLSSHTTHTIHDMQRYIDASKGVGNIPGTYISFCKMFESFGQPRSPLLSPTSTDFAHSPLSREELDDPQFNVPTLNELGYTEMPTTTLRGGETEALKRLQEKVSQRPEWTAQFEKPLTAPNSLEPSTTELSPYLKFGCLSVAQFAHALQEACGKRRHTEPPVSLMGQLLWREWFYLNSYVTPHFDKMEGNPRCRQIQWERDPEKILAWKEARTGYPFIDACMTQLRVQGWIHHLARHAVACFLTRGDLYQHWEEGVKVFDLYLLDSDWALNNANWQWLSCSNFFYQYFRVYSPVTFGKKTDPNGDYIRKWIPQLRDFPAKYIYEPWTAPSQVQTAAGCVIGRDYPLPVVDHATASQQNKDKIAAAYAIHKQTHGNDTHSVENVSGSGSGRSKGTTKSSGSARTKEPKNVKKSSMMHQTTLSFLGGDKTEKKGGDDTDEAVSVLGKRRQGK